MTKDCKRSGFWVWDSGGSIDGPENWLSHPGEFPNNWKPTHVHGTLQKVFPSGEIVKCNSGHETPHSIWNCPKCTDIKIEKYTTLVVNLRKYFEAKKGMTNYEIGKLLSLICEE